MACMARQQPPLVQIVCVPVFGLLNWRVAAPFVGSVTIVCHALDLLILHRLQVQIACYASQPTHCGGYLASA